MGREARSGLTIDLTDSADVSFVSDVAHRRHVSVADAEAIVSRFSSFGDFVTHIANAYPDNYSHAFSSEDARSQLLHLTVMTPKATLETIRAAAPLGVVVSADSLFSEHELQSTAADLGLEYHQQFPGEDWPTIAPSADRRTLKIWTRSDVKSAIERWHQRRADSAQLGVQFVGPPPVIVLAESVVGGAELNSPGGGVCTSGFTVTSSAGSGVLTAEHCSNDLLYGAQAWLVFKAGHWGLKGDVQWHSTTKATPPQFQYEPGKITTVKTVRIPYDGMLVRRYGRYSWDSTYLSVAEAWHMNGSGDNYNILTLTNPNSSVVGGDSGGPVWNGASGGAAAVGLTAAYDGPVGNRALLFSAASSVYDALGVVIKTG